MGHQSLEESILAVNWEVPLALGLWLVSKQALVPFW